MILYLLHNPPLKKVYFNNWGKQWVKNKIIPFEDYLKKNESILDIGSGNGLVAWELINRGFSVTPLDIASQEFDHSVKPIVYDGKKMPFKDNQFDVSLLSSALLSNPVNRN